jgi:hypothetical protein
MDRTGKLDTLCHRVDGDPGMVSLRPRRRRLRRLWAVQRQIRQTTVAPGGSWLNGGHRERNHVEGQRAVRLRTAPGPGRAGTKDPPGLGSRPCISGLGWVRVEPEVWRLAVDHGRWTHSTRRQNGVLGRRSRLNGHSSLRPCDKELGSWRVPWGLTDPPRHTPIGQ